MFHWLTDDSAELGGGERPGRGGGGGCVYVDVGEGETCNA